MKKILSLSLFIIFFYSWSSPEANKEREEYRKNKSKFEKIQIEQCIKLKGFPKRNLIYDVVCEIYKENNEK